MNSSDEISNFIDKSDKVFLLSDNDSKISLDIPFENQCSGSIIINIESNSPIFIRNHYLKGDDFYIREKDGKKQTISQNFCHYNGKRYIPASSIKGMVRNTLEILSYAKLKNKTLDAYLEKKVSEDNLHRSEKMDLSEAIFGTTELKGRIHFSHFKEIGHSEEMPLQKEILGTPEAKKKKFGWKNYPILENTTTGKGGKNDKVKSEFKPLPSGTKFEGVLRFHNLRDFELGALLSALKFHNTESCYHNIGLGKGLGYGAIEIKFKYDNLEKYLQSFEEKINVELFEGKVLWHRSPYIKELLNKHSDSKLEVQSYSSKATVDKLYKKKQEDAKRKMEVEKQNLLKKNTSVVNIPDSFSKEFKKAIENYITSSVKLPFYDYNHLKLLLQGKVEDIVSDDIFYAYSDLNEKVSFQLIRPLLIEREKKTITDSKLAELYILLVNSIIK